MTCFSKKHQCFNRNTHENDKTTAKIEIEIKIHVDTQVNERTNRFSEDFSAEMIVPGQLGL